MPTAIYRPNATVNSSGATVVGAASMHAALNEVVLDTSDYTRRAIPPFGPAFHFGIVRFDSGSADFTGKVITAVEMVAVASQPGGHTAPVSAILRDAIEHGSAGGKDLVPIPGTTPTECSVDWDVNPYTGLPWTEADIQEFGTTGAVTYGFGADHDDQRVQQLFMRVHWELKPLSVGPAGLTVTAGPLLFYRTEHESRSKIHGDLIYNGAAARFGPTWEDWPDADIGVLLLQGFPPPEAADPDLLTVADLLAVPGVVEADGAGYERKFLDGKLVSHYTHQTFIDVREPVVWHWEVQRTIWASVFYEDGYTDADRLLVSYQDENHPFRTSAFSERPMTLTVPTGVLVMGTA